MDWSLSDIGHGKGDEDIDRTVTIVARSPPRREFPGRCCSPDRGLLDCADSINADCLNPYHVTRDLAAWLQSRFIGAQTDRPGCAANHDGQDRQGTPDPWRCHSPAHTPRGVYDHQRHHVTGRKQPATRRHHFRIASNTKTMTAALIMELAQENKLNLDDPVEVRSGRAQRRQHHHRRTAEYAQRPLQLQQ
jgi:beta-lactamase family protein